ncbi:MAG: hypothetical protein AAF902_08735 [Chloroflexota bacterium]
MSKRFTLFPYSIIAQHITGRTISDLNGGEPIHNKLSPDNAYEKLFKSFLIFSDPEAFVELSSEDIIYNQYFWYMRIRYTYGVTGEEAGLYDYDLVVLRYAEVDLNWEIIEEVSEFAKKDVDP